LLLELIRMKKSVRRAGSSEHGSSVIPNLMGSHYSVLLRLKMGIIMVCELLLLLSLNRYESLALSLVVHQRLVYWSILDDPSLDDRLALKPLCKLRPMANLSLDKLLLEGRNVSLNWALHHKGTLWIVLHQNRSDRSFMHD